MEEIRQHLHQEEDPVTRQLKSYCQTGWRRGVLKPYRYVSAELDCGERIAHGRIQSGEIDFTEGGHARHIPSGNNKVKREGHAPSLNAR